MEKIKFYKDNSNIIVVEFDKDNVFYWSNNFCEVGQTKIISRDDKELWFIKDELTTEYINFIYWKLYGKY